MTAQICSFEPCSKTVTVSDLRSLARKQLSLHLQLCKDYADKRLPMPVQWVISPGRPDSGLTALQAMPVPGWPSGFYYGGPLLEMWIVVLSELPDTAETRLLRLLGPRAMRQRAMAEIAALPAGDPAKRSWLEIMREMVYFLVEKTDVAAEEQGDMTQLRQEFEQFQAGLIRRGRAEGKAEGRAEGKVEGKAEGKAEALLAILTARGVVVNGLVREKILTCNDQALLDRWLVQALTVTSADDLLAAA